MKLRNHIKKKYYHKRWMGVFIEKMIAEIRRENNAVPHPEWGWPHNIGIGEQP